MAAKGLESRIKTFWNSCNTLYIITLNMQESLESSDQAKILNHIEEKPIVLDPLKFLDTHATVVDMSIVNSVLFIYICAAFWLCVLSRVYNTLGLSIVYI